MSPHPVARSRAAALVVVPLLLLAACASAPPPPPVPAGWQQHVLTPDGSDTVGLQATAADAVTARAPSSNTGVNLRVLFTRSAIEPTRDQEVCTTFSDAGGVVQEGIAFDIRRKGERTTALTVTKNIWMHGNWAFNVHVWDTAQADPHRRVTSLDMSHVLGHRPQGAATWRLCGRVIGTRLDVWVSASAAGASWTSPAVRSTTVPRSTEPGRPGWYVGHVRAGEWARFTDMAAGAPASPDAPVPPDPVDQPRSNSESEPGSPSST